MNIPTVVRSLILSSVIASLILVVASLLPATATADAQELTGYAWSDNIGWISMSGAGYGITIGSSGVLSGYAWSDNIGWISAQSSDTAGCPKAPCAPTFDGTRLTGWLRAIAANGHGWDGWISLSGVSTNNAPYGVSFSGTSFAGYAWGSDVVGWVDMSLVKINDEGSCPNGLDKTLYLSCRCPAGQVQSGTRCIPTLCPNGLDKTLYLSCRCPAGQTQSGTRCVATLCANGLDKTLYPTCRCPSGRVQQGSVCVVPAPLIDVQFHARPSLVRPGDPSFLYWDVSSVTRCTISGNGQSWTALRSPAGGQMTAPITQQTVYAMTCTALPGYTPPTFTQSATINVVPTFEEM